MKPFVKVTLDLGVEEVVLNFTDTKDIDGFIEVLEAARGELEHKIEMKRIKNKERRKWRKGKLALDKLNVRQVVNSTNEVDEQMLHNLCSEYDKIFNLYNNLPECKLKSDLKPYVELSKALIDAMKND